MTLHLLSQLEISISKNIIYFIRLPHQPKRKLSLFFSNRRTIIPLEISALYSLETHFVYNDRRLHYMCGKNCATNPEKNLKLLGKMQSSERQLNTLFSIMRKSIYHKIVVLGIIINPVTVIGRIDFSPFLKIIPLTLNHFLFCIVN